MDCFKGANGYDWIASITENTIRLKRNYLIGHELEQLQKLFKVEQIIYDLELKDLIICVDHWITPE